MISIARPISGISINGKEYVLDKNGMAILFENEEKARGFLIENGYSDEDIEAEGLVFEEEEDT